MSKTEKRRGRSLLALTLSILMAVTGFGWAPGGSGAAVAFAGEGGIAAALTEGGGYPVTITGAGSAYGGTYTYVGGIQGYTYADQAAARAGAGVAGTRELLISDQVFPGMSWDSLNEQGLIYGDYDAPSIIRAEGKAYYAVPRALTAGQYPANRAQDGLKVGSALENNAGLPDGNEWDVIVSKSYAAGAGTANDTCYIKNWDGQVSFAQDVCENGDAAVRGLTARGWNHCPTDYTQSTYGYRPALEILGEAPLAELGEASSMTMPEAAEVSGDVTTMAAGDILTYTIPEGQDNAGQPLYFKVTGEDPKTVMLVRDATGSEEFGTSAYKEYTGSLVIPDTVNGYTVTSIGMNVFNRCTKFTGGLTLPSGLTSIGEYAFNQCSGFTGNLVLPNGLTSIEENTFFMCSGFTGNLTLPSGLTSIGKTAFYRCSGFTGNLVLPSGLTSIGVSAFQQCTGFTGNLVLSSGLTSIGDQAFYQCSGFTGNLALPGGLTSIGENAFDGCSGFTGSLTLPSGLTKIEISTFQYCSGLTSVTLPSRLVTINSSAFKGCTGLKSLTLPSGVTFGLSLIFSGTSLTELFAQKDNGLTDDVVKGGSSATVYRYTLAEDGTLPIQASTPVPAVGTVLSPGELTGTTHAPVNPLHYEWYRNGSPIDIGSTYTLTDADVAEGTGISVMAVAEPTKDHLYLTNVRSAPLLMGVDPAITAEGDDQQITITWQETSGVDYQLYYAMSETAPEAEWTAVSAGAIQGGSYVHTGLTKGTTYYYKLKASSANGEIWSEIVSVTLGFPFEAVVTVSGTAKFGETLTADVTNVSPAAAACEVRWYRQDTAEPVATGAAYTLTAADVGKTMTAKAVGIGEYFGEVPAEATAAVEKADAPVAPAAPALAAESLTDTTVVLTTEAGLEYRLGTDGEWQSSGVFEGLTAGTVYTFYARMAETDTHLAGAVSEALAVTTHTYGIAAESGGAALNADKGLKLKWQLTGYTTPPAATVTLSNTGTGTLTGLSAALSGENAGSFELGALSGTEAAVGETVTFTVAPVTQLPQATYSAIVTVTAERGEALSFPVVFQVSDTPLGVAVSGRVESYNPRNAVTLQLMQGDEVKYTTVIEAADSGNGKITQDFAFDTVEAGTYTLFVKKPAHTTYTVHNVVIGSDPVDLTLDSRPGAALISLLPGDLNGDGTIGAGDINLILNVANNGKKPDSPGVNSLTDLNGDLTIGAGDINIILNTAYNGQGDIVIE